MATSPHSLSVIVPENLFVEEGLPTDRGFWTRQRTLSWKPKYFDFQATNIDYSGFLSELSA